MQRGGKSQVPTRPCGSDKSRATFSEMNTLQIFPALILLARLQKTNLQPCLLHRAPATQRVRPVSFLSQILSRLTQCGEYNVSKEGASHSPPIPFHEGRKIPRHSPSPLSAINICKNSKNQGVLKVLSI